jgi:hypothetical protein
MDIAPRLSASFAALRGPPFQQDTQEGKRHLARVLPRVR